MVSSSATAALLSAAEVAGQTPDPELPFVSIAELGILRSVTVDGDGVVVTITPTYSGCPAMREIATDVVARLERAGCPGATVRFALAPAWTTDWITEDGRRKLAEAGIAPPGPAADVGAVRGATLVRLSSTVSRAMPSCPRCGSPRTEQTAAFSSTACKSLHRCLDCREPFEAVKPL